MEVIMGEIIVALRQYTERSISFGSGKHRLYCPYWLARVDINSAKGCLAKAGKSGCQFYDGVEMGKIICIWTKAHGVAVK